MTSLQIAEITGKTHSNVMRDIRNILEQLEDRRQFSFELSSRPQPMPNGGSKEVSCYILTKKDCLLLASGYDANLRAKIINRWEELEENKRELSRKDLALMVLQAEEEKQRLALEVQKKEQEKQTIIEEAKPAVVFTECVTSSSTNILIGDFTPLGTLELAFMTGNSVKKDMRKYVEEKNLGCGSYRYVPTVKRMVSKAVEEAKSLGANGIISFEIKRVHDVKKNNSDMDTYYVTGIPVIYKK